MPIVMCSFVVFAGRVGVSKCHQCQKIQDLVPVMFNPQQDFLCALNLSADIHIVVILYNASVQEASCAYGYF